jgi:hypothetical protein
LWPFTYLAQIAFGFPLACSMRASSAPEFYKTELNALEVKKRIDRNCQEDQREIRN